MAGGMGFALGGAFGLFMSSVRRCYVNPFRAQSGWDQNGSLKKSFPLFVYLARY
jgi:hypothetical protein